MGLFDRLIGGRMLAQDGGNSIVYAPDDDHWYGADGKVTTSGVKITPDMALKASGLYACVSILAKTMASLHLKMYKRLPEGGNEPAPYHPLDEVIRYQPNNIQTAAEFWETMMFHAVLRGNAYAEIIPGARGSVDQLRSLHTDRVRVEYMKDHTLRFQVSDPVSGRTRVLLQEEVFRIPGLSSDGVTGLRAIDLVAESVGLGIAADRYASRIFSNAFNIGGFIKTKTRMSPEAQKRLISKLTAQFAGPSNFHRPALLQGDFEFINASMKANEAQLLEARRAQIAEFARFFHIPLYRLGIDDQSNRATAEEENRNFVSQTIGPWANKIEQAIRRDLIEAPRYYEARFNLDSLERGNMEARAKFYSAALGEGGNRPGWMTVNEVRRREGQNPIKETWADQVPRPTPGVAQVTNNPSDASDDTGDDNAALPSPPKALEDNSALARGQRVARKECVAIRKAAMRLADKPDEFRDWVRAFYGSHVGFVMEMLGFEKEKAKAYCKFQCDEVLSANDIEGLVACREESLAACLADAVKAKGDDDGLDAAV